MDFPVPLKGRFGDYSRRLDLAQRLTGYQQFSLLAKRCCFGWAHVMRQPENQQKPTLSMC
jgi:hypothetical protein